MIHFTSAHFASASVCVGVVLPDGLALLALTHLLFSLLIGPTGSASESIIKSTCRVLAASLQHPDLWASLPSTSSLFMSELWSSASYWHAMFITLIRWNKRPCLSWPPLNRSERLPENRAARAERLNSTLPKSKWEKEEWKSRAGGCFVFQTRKKRVSRSWQYTYVNRH